MSLAGPGAGEKRNAAWAVTRPTGGAGLPGPIFASGGLLGGFPSACLCDAVAWPAGPYRGASEFRPTIFMFPVALGIAAKV
jgi:hypothetical protein